MNSEHTADLMEGLKLKGMADEFRAIMSLPMQKRPGLELAVAKLVDAERLYRDQCRTSRYMKASKLRYMASIEDIECSTERNLTKDMLAEIADCNFIRRAENLLITGLTGCGKSFLACALGRQACTLGFRTEYLNMNRFMDAIAQSKLDGTFVKLLNHLNRFDLVILDDFGLQSMDQNTRIALLQMLEDRYERKATIIISQLPVAQWYEYIAEPTLADAICDRLLNNSTQIDLKGESMRRKKRK